MARDLPIGNGNLLIAFDKDYRLREFFFPHVGEENHTNGAPFRFGVWVNGQFSWVPDGWKLTRDYLDDTLVTNVELIHPGLKLRIVANDLVDFQDNIYLKRLTLENLSDEPKEIRLFFAHDFRIYGNEIGDTAEYKPDVKAVVHYKAERYFLVNIYTNKKYGIDQFSTGNKNPQTQEGTWRDCEDGLLGDNPISQGSVDSAIVIPLSLAPRASDRCYYWIAAGKDWEEVKALNASVKKRTPELIFERTRDYWKLWVDQQQLNYELLPAKLGRLYRRSLLIGRTQINNCGSIIAANDSDAMAFNRDTYSYLWPRDGALVAYAYDLAGYGETRDFYRFCSDVLTEEGCLLHKYTPSGSVGSSWHPWQKNKKAQLPIQEDETALVIWALWNHFKQFRDIEFVRPLYECLIKKAADFMMNYRDIRTGLPQVSYDLWEERQGVLSFTVAAVYGGLIAAAHFAEAFGETSLAQDYRDGAAQMRKGMDQHLYLDKEKRFARMVQFKKDGSVEVDVTIDASLYGIVAFGAYPADDPRVKTTMEQLYNALWHKEGGGLARYEGDTYYRTQPGGPGNPWFVTTLWYAQYTIALAKTHDELNRALPLLEWVADHALPSGVLAEQLDPKTHEPLSVSPLTWSHAAYIATVQEYLNKLVEIDRCSSCGQPKVSKTRHNHQSL
jgi:glucoamylase